MAKEKKHFADKQRTGAINTTGGLVKLPPLKVKEKEPDFASMTLGEVKAYADAHPYHCIHPENLLSKVGAAAFTKRYGEYMFSTLSPEQQHKMLLEASMGATNPKEVYRRYFPNWPKPNK